MKLPLINNVVGLTLMEISRIYYSVKFEIIAADWFVSSKLLLSSLFFSKFYDVGRFSYII